jgi:A/G-specific adenine glycosylase
MCQQTQVDTVIPYFLRWMDRFPTIQSLADADLQDVLKLWEGLGYYSRARNLHRAAHQVMTQFGGIIPETRDALATLPGIGPYTAGAIASLAFGHDEAALDGNIRRVLARLFDVDIPARSPAGETRLWSLAREVLPPGQAGDWNQALMDLGAMVCTPHKPACQMCPLQVDCRAFALGNQSVRPVMAPRPTTPLWVVTAAVIQRDSKVLIALRPPQGLLGGLWEFPGGKVEAGESLEDGLRREILEELGVTVAVGEPLGVYKHAYTHFKVRLHAFFCTLPAANSPQPLHHSALAWVSPPELITFPMGKIDRMISQDLARMNLP